MRSKPQRLLPNVLLRVLPISIAVLFAIWYLAFDVAEMTVRNELNSRLAREATHGAAEIALKLETIRDAVEALSENDLIVNSLIDTVGRETYLSTMFRSLRMPGPASARISITDYRGRLLASNNKERKDYAETDWISEVMSGKSKALISGHGLLIAKPVQYGGLPEGAVIYQLSYRDLSTYITANEIAAAIAVKLQDGSILYLSNEGSGVKGQNFTPRENPEWAQISARVPGFPNLTFIAAEAKAKAFAPLIRLRRLMLSAILISILFVTIGIVTTGYFVTRPVQRFIEAIRHIHSTKQLAYRIAPFGAAEFQTLASEFNQMLDQIENTTTTRNVLAREIEQRKKTMHELVRFKVALDNTLDMIVMFNPDTLRLTYFNNGAVSMTGYSQVELNFLRAYELRPGGTEAEFREFLTPLLSGEQTSLCFEITHRRKSGQIYPVEISLQLVEMDDTRVFVALIKDITERKKIEQMKNEFISTVSHELRTPLTSIMGSLGLIRGEAIGALPEKIKSMIGIAHNNSERLVRLINDILDIEKIESGSEDFDLLPLELGPLIVQAVEANQPFANQFDIRFSVVTDLLDATVYADSDRMMQVLTNLISNAVKYSQTNGVVVISAGIVGERVRVSVGDTGPGISVEFRDRIFDKFAQADSSDSRQKGGTGLGLHICKAIIEQFDGTISFETEIDEGTTFFFELPIWRSPLVGIKPFAMIDANSILICEHDQDVAALLATILKRTRLEPHIAKSAHEAKAMLGSRNYAAMTLDLRLPDQNGLSFIQELRAEQATRDLPIIVVSAIADRGKRELHGKALGIVDWLNKPIDEARLLRAVKQCFDGPDRFVPKILHVEDDIDIISVVTTYIGDIAELTAAYTLAEAKHLLDHHQFDLVILDLVLPDGSGEALIEHLHDGHQPPPPIILFSAHESSHALSKRVAAALVKSRTPMEHLLDIVARNVSRDAPDEPAGQRTHIAGR